MLCGFPSAPPTNHLIPQNPRAMLSFQKRTNAGYDALLFLLLACFIVHSLGLGQHERQTEREAEADTRMPIIEAATTLFSFPTTWPFSLPNSVKAAISQHWPCFPHWSCPNLDFRGGGGNVGETVGGMGGEGGAKERIREAVVKTLEKSRSVVEDSAKSAAEAMDMTVKKLKKILSSKGKEGVAAEL